MQLRKRVVAPGSYRAIDENVQPLLIEGDRQASLAFTDGISSFRPARDAKRSMAGGAKA